MLKIKAPEYNLHTFAALPFLALLVLNPQHFGYFRKAPFPTLNLTKVHKRTVASSCQRDTRYDPD